MLTRRNAQTPEPWATANQPQRRVVALVMVPVVLVMVLALPPTMIPAPSHHFQSRMIMAKFPMVYDVHLNVNQPRHLHLALALTSVFPSRLVKTTRSCSIRSCGDCRLHGMDLWPGVTQRPGHQLPCTAASCDGEALRQRALFSTFRGTPRRASAHARTRCALRTRTDDRRRTTRRAVRRRGSLEDCRRGGHGAYAHRLSARPHPCDSYRHALATRALQGGRPERPGLLFLKRTTALTKPRQSIFFAWW